MRSYSIFDSGMQKIDSAAQVAARVLRECIAREGYSVAAVSSGAGYHAPYLGSVLRGRQDLKFEHVERALGVLEISPGEFFARLAAELRHGRHPSEIREPVERYGEADIDYILRRAREEGERDRVRLEERIRRAVDEELTRRLGGDGATE